MTLERKPPRRDPRVLALVPSKDVIEYATLDAWEISGTGVLATGDPKGFALSMRRLIVKTRPTAIVCVPPRARGSKLAKLLTVAAAVAKHSGIRLTSLSADRARELLDEAPTINAIAEQYPELRALGSEEGTAALRLASAALTSLHYPSRSYETSNAARSPAVLVAGRARRTRRARVPRRAPGRGSDRSDHRGGHPRPRTPRA